MAKTKAKRPAAKKAAVKKTQPARKQPARRVSTGSHSSASAVSSIAKSPAVTVSVRFESRIPLIQSTQDPTQAKHRQSLRSFSACQVWANQDQLQPVSNACRVHGCEGSSRKLRFVLPRLQSNVPPESTSATLQLDEWYWILAAAIPIELPGRQRLLETFASIYDCPASERKIPKKDSPWTDPFYDFVWVACECICVCLHAKLTITQANSSSTTSHLADRAAPGR